VEESAAEEATMVWRSQSRWATVGGGVEEPATPGRGGARGGADCRGGDGVEEPATAGCSWTGAGLGLSLLTSVGFPSRRKLSS
jgi:hypothetical protein